LRAHVNIGLSYRVTHIVFLLFAGPSSAQLSLLDESWFVATLIVCVGSALWIAMCVVVACIVRRRRRRHMLAHASKYSNGQKPGTTQQNIKISIKQT